MINVESFHAAEFISLQCFEPFLLTVNVLAAVGVLHNPEDGGSTTI